jgi:hypothetical protein
LDYQEKKGAYVLTNKAYVAKVNASDIIAEISNVLWEHESLWK